jgi:hypothetical protein
MGSLWCARVLCVLPLVALLLLCLFCSRLDLFLLYKVILYLSVIYFLYCLKYRVVGVDVCVVHLRSVSTHRIYDVYTYISNVFRCFVFLSVFKTFIVLVVLPYLCSVFNICFEYPELPLLFLIAWTCSLYLVLNVRPVCPIHFNGQSMHLILYTPLFHTRLLGEALLSFVCWFLFGMRS